MDDTKTPSKYGKRYSPSEKLEIIQQTKHASIKTVSKQFGVSRAIIYRWLKAFDRKGTQRRRQTDR